MPTKRYKPEQVVTLLRRIEVEIANGKTAPQACPTNYKFTGYERDSETGLDYAFARYYSSRLGRFLSTDPLGGSVGSVQSHNAYAYTLNNPLNAVDPSGMSECAPGEILCWLLGGDNFWDGRPYVGLGGTVHQFDILQLAFTPTGITPNPAFWNSSACILGDCPGIPMYLQTFGNWNLLDLLNFMSGGGDRISTQPHNCLGFARVIAGNPDTIGKPGGLSGNTVGNVNVQAGSAAIAPSQWPGATKDVLRDVGMQISGVSANSKFPLDLTGRTTNVPFSFSGVTDIIGPPSNQQKLLNQFPGALLIELPSMPKSEDAYPYLRSIELTLPWNLPCPQGTGQE